ncbi:MAG TPA: diacylglycerol kinase family protein [Vicinamibacterales bacterium]
MSWAVVLNHRSGTAPAQADLEQALQRAGVSADILPVPAALGAGSIDDTAAQYDVLVAAGGDGTVSTVAGAAVRAGKVFGVIPCGTLNHFARDAGIPSDLDEAAAVLAAGRTRRLDVGVVNDRIFINNASIGAYPRMVWERNRARRRGLPRPLAAGLAVARTWFDLRSVAARLTIDGREIVRSTPFIFIGNSAYDVEGTDIGRRPTMTDGKLSLYMAPRFGRGDALLLPMRVLLKTLEEHERFESFEAASISIETSSARVSVGIDGEIRMLDAPLRFSVRSDALETILPEAEA